MGELAAQAVEPERAALRDRAACWRSPADTARTVCAICCGRFERVFVIGPQQRAGFLQRRFVTHALQHVGQPRVVLSPHRRRRWWRRRGRPASTPGGSTPGRARRLRAARDAAVRERTRRRKGRASGRRAATAPASSPASKARSGNPLRQPESAIRPAVLPSRSASRRRASRLRPRNCAAEMSAARFAYPLRSAASSTRRGEWVGTSCAGRALFSRPRTLGGDPTSSVSSAPTIVPSVVLRAALANRT